jgi:hypothetical protein
MKITDNNLTEVFFTAVNKASLAAGRYIFTVAPIDGLPVGVSLNDLCQYTGTVWQLLLKYTTVPPTMQGGTPLKTFIKNENNSWVVASKKTPKIINSSSVFVDDSIGEKETFDLANFVKSSISTGVISGAQLISSGSTFSVTAGSGLIINNETIEGTPSITSVNIPFTPNNAIITGVSVNYILINSAGAVVVLSTKPTAAQRRTNIYLGRLNLNNAKNSILDVINDKAIQYNPSKQMQDYIGAAYRNVGRIRVVANGANMLLNLIGGEIVGTGVGYSSNINSPNSLIVPNQTGFNFRMATQTSIIDAIVNSLPNASNFDSNGVITANGGANGTAINHRVYIQANGGIVIQYGQQVYTSLATATAAIPNESFVANPINSIGNALLIGFISVVRNATTLNNTGQAIFTTATPYGDASAGVGGGVAYVGINNINVVGSNIDGSLLSAKIPNALTITNLPTGGVIGLATATVDIFEAFNIAQTTAGQTVTLPNPSVTTNQKLVYVCNTGTASFNLYGTNLEPNKIATLIYNTTNGWMINSGGSGSSGATTLSIPNLTDLVTYTPTFTGYGTPTNVKFSWARRGPVAIILGYMNVGVTNNALASFSLPTGLTISSIFSTNYATVGTAVWGGDTTTSGRGYSSIAKAGDSVIYINYEGGNAGTQPNSLNPLTGTTLFANGQIITFQVEIPIQGWAANTTVNSVSQLYQTTSAPLASAIANSVTTVSNIKVRYNANGTGGNLDIACVSGTLTCQLITARQIFNGGLTTNAFSPNVVLTTTFDTYANGGLDGSAEFLDYEIFVSNSELYEVKLRLTGSSGTDLVLINLTRIY